MSFYFSFHDTISNLTGLCYHGVIWILIHNAILCIGLSILSPIIGECIIADSETIWEEFGKEDGCL